MELRSVAIGAAVTLLIIGATAGGYFAATALTERPASTPTDTPTEQSDQPVSPNEAPEDVKQSLDGAKLMTEKMQAEGYSDVRVFITDSGEVQVVYTSKVDHGPELKEEMRAIAILYTETLEEHPETGGVTVTTRNGVQMLVSKDTAQAYVDGDIKKEAFFKTLSFKNVGQEE